MTGRERPGGAAERERESSGGSHVAAVLEEEDGVSNVTHPAPCFRREVHPEHMDGANVICIEANKHDAREVELVAVLHQPRAPRVHPLREIDHADVEVLELRLLGGVAEVDGAHVFC